MYDEQMEQQLQKRLSACESSDIYQGVIFYLPPKFRVARSREGLQWLYQRRRAGRSQLLGRWETVAYSQTREGLQRTHRRFADGESELIDGLPSHIREERR